MLSLTPSPKYRSVRAVLFNSEIAMFPMTKEMFMAHISDMRYKPHELAIISIAYELGELVHRKEKRRADGKFYWQHPVEVALSAVAVQRTLHIRNARTIALSLVHDVGETILKAFYHMQEMSEETDDADIFILGNFQKIASLTSALKDLDGALFEEMRTISKSRNPEEKKKYFPGLTLCSSISVLFTKILDRGNNAETFDKIPTSQKRKVEETLTYFPLFIARLDALVKKAVMRGELSEDWLALAPHLHQMLASVMSKYVTNFPKLF
jgi:(p)ppGpp synthase/HD superfamily hydrolase